MTATLLKPVGLSQASELRWSALGFGRFCAEGSLFRARRHVLVSLDRLLGGLAPAERLCPLETSPSPPLGIGCHGRRREPQRLRVTVVHQLSRSIQDRKSVV